MFYVGTHYNAAVSALRLSISNNHQKGTLKERADTVLISYTRFWSFSVHSYYLLQKKPTVRRRACAICQPSGLETQCRRNCRSTPSATPMLSIPDASFPSQPSSVEVLARFEGWNFWGRHRMLAALASVLEVVTTCVSMRSGRGRQKRCKAVETSPIFLFSCVRACMCACCFFYGLSFSGCPCFDSLYRLSRVYINTYIPDGT